MKNKEEMIEVSFDESIKLGNSPSSEFVRLELIPAKDGYVLLSPAQARRLGKALIRFADRVEKAKGKK